MQIIFLHSAQVEASRAIISELGGDPQWNSAEEVVNTGGREVRVISRHGRAVSVSPNFSAYPAIVVRDGESVRVKSPVESWAECLDFIDNPPVPPVAVPKVELTKLEFLGLFTDEEKIKLKGLEGTDPAVGLFWEEYRAASSIRLDDPRTIRAITMLAAAGHITDARAAEILEGA